LRPRQCWLRDDSDMSPPERVGVSPRPVSLVRRRGSSTEGRLDRSLLLAAAGSDAPEDDSSLRFRIFSAAILTVAIAAAAASSRPAPSSTSRCGIAATTPDLLRISQGQSRAMRVESVLSTQSSEAVKKND
jgi:hypothetical protein